MPFDINQVNRPNQLTGRKDKDYHLQFGRWAASTIGIPEYKRFLRKSMVNRAFNKNQQWIYEEDLAGFLMDDSGNIRHRLQLTQNAIRPVVQFFKGSAINMDFDISTKPISEFSINKRETLLNKLKFFTDVANDNPDTIGPILQAQAAIGENRADTDEIFENEYVDDAKEKVEALMQHIREYNDIPNQVVRGAEHLALTGIVIPSYIDQTNEFVTKLIEPEFFLYDTGAMLPDLSDGSFMGHWSFMAAEEVFERWQDISFTDKERVEQTCIDNSIHNGNNNRSLQYMSTYMNNVNNRVPVFNTYWRDKATMEYGYVTDEFGYEFFTLINDDQSIYTDKDLIKVKDNPHEDVLKGEMKAKMDVDILRYCIFIPKETFGGGSTAVDVDIALEWGVSNLQEVDSLDPQRVSYPYKPETWGYDQGEILSPIDDMISPQRFANRVLSVMENQVNYSGGAGLTIDQRSIDPQDGEEGIKRRIATNQPITLDALKVGGIQNAVGKYDNNVGAGTFNLLAIKDSILQGMESVTGVNEGVKGSAPGKGLLKGVLEQQIQSGQNLQEPFFYALSRAFEKLYYASATVGISIYSKSKRKLAIRVGDEGVRILEGLDKLRPEDFRFTVKRSLSMIDRVQAGDALLFNLLQMQLIDAKVFANLFGRATTEKIAKELRTYQSRLSEAQKIAQQEENQRIQEALQLNREEQGRLEQKENAMLDREDRHRLEDVESDILTTNNRNLGQTQKGLAIQESKNAQR